MDTHEIDFLARVLVTYDRRRTALRVALGLGLAGVMGWRGAGLAAAGAGCTKLRRRCRHHRQCCSLACRQGRCRR
jgi:hypothetical protein